MTNNLTIIGITGHIGAGKTTLARAIVRASYGLERETGVRIMRRSISTRLINSLEALSGVTFPNKDWWERDAPPPFAPGMTYRRAVQEYGESSARVFGPSFLIRGIIHDARKLAAEAPRGEQLVVLIDGVRRWQEFDVCVSEGVMVAVTSHRQNSKDDHAVEVHLDAMVGQSKAVFRNHYETVERAAEMFAEELACVTADINQTVSNAFTRIRDELEKK